MRFRFLLFLISSIILPAKCFAHVSERALILLLPTEFYIPAGISVLILTILIAYLTPASFISSLFSYYQIKNFNFFSIISDRSFEKIKIITSLFSFLLILTQSFAVYFTSDRSNGLFTVLLRLSKFFC